MIWLGFGGRAIFFSRFTVSSYQFRHPEPGAVPVRGSLGLLRRPAPSRGQPSRPVALTSACSASNFRRVTERGRAGGTWTIRRQGSGSISAAPLPMSRSKRTGAGYSAKILTTPEAPERAVIDAIARGAARSRRSRRPICRSSSTARRWRPTRSSSARAPGPRWSPPRGSATRSRSGTRTASSNTTSISTCRRRWCRAGCALPCRSASTRAAGSSCRSTRQAVDALADRLAAARRRERRDRLSAQLHQPGARAAHRARSSPRGCPASASRLSSRGVARDARIRALLDGLRQRLCPADDRALSRAISKRCCAAEGFALPAVPDAVGRRADDGRDGDPLSGAAGRIAARPAARSSPATSPGNAALDKVLSYDMGGTTAKICLIDEYQPQTSRAFEVARIYRFKKGSGLPLRIPVIEMVEIGAGGGSIARVDRLKRITVGPDSAGADPGPACYGRGGTAPTVTDADLLLGRIDPTGFSGGRMALDRAAAETRDAARGGGAARSGAAARGVRGQRDRRREHGQRRARACDRERQGRARPHAGRVRRRGAAARRADGREARARPGAGAVACRGRLGGRVSARADRLRDRALAIAAARRVRRRRRQRAARRDAGRGRGDRPARRAARRR